MNDQPKPFFYGYEPEEPPEEIVRELAKLGLDDKRFSPLDYGEQLADYVGSSFRIRPIQREQAGRGFKQRLNRALMINRLSGNFYDPREANLLLSHAKRLSNLTYDPAENEFLIEVSEELKPPSSERIDRELTAALSTRHFGLGRKAYFWRKNYFLSYTLDLAIYRQLSHIACGHPLRLPTSSDWFWPPVRQLAEEGPTLSDLPDKIRAELYEREADRRAL